MVKTGHFEFSTDGGATWTEIDFTARTGNAAGRYCDFGVTPDGNTLIVCFEQIISAGNWPAVFVSTDRGSSWTDISANLLYPVSSGGPPGGVPTGCSSCNVAPDGLGMVVTFEYTDNPHTEPDGLTGYTTYANVSIDAGATFTLCSFDADPLQVGSALGLFTATFIVGPPTPPPPGPTSPGGYIIERLDNRIWPTVEDCWCVDCAFTLARPQPAADIQMSTATGAGILTGVTSLNGGHNYSASTTATVVDDNGLGPGTGAVAVLTIVSGVITAIAFSPAGSGYVYPQLVFNDPENTGSGASATITIDNTAMFIASAPVFVVGDVGSVIRCGLGVATITEFLDAEHVIANITSPIVQVKEDDPLDPYTPITFLSGTWTMTAPITQFRIPQLAGFEITGLADGQIIPPTLVPANGLVTLAQPASAIIVGLAFQAQLQSTYLDAGEPTVQGQRKKIAEVTVRVEQSAAFQIGGNQPDGSVQSPQQLAPLWQNMVDAPTHAVAPFGSTALPLYTGDIRIPTPSGYNTRGQIAVQQLNPLPLQVLDYVPEVLAGDKASQEAPKREPPQNGRKGR
jgi:hypothetical protein